MNLKTYKENFPEYEDNKSFEPIESGTYEALIERAEIRKTKNNRGTILCLTWVILSDKYEGRKIFENLNIENENEKAVQIGAKILSEIETAIGSEVNDTEELLNIPVRIVVSILLKDGGKRNIIKKRLNKLDPSLDSNKVADLNGVEKFGEKPPWE